MGKMLIIARHEVPAWMTASHAGRPSRIYCTTVGTLHRDKMKRIPY
jgi:hypothetical protein